MAWYDLNPFEIHYVEIKFKINSHFRQYQTRVMLMLIKAKYNIYHGDKLRLATIPTIMYKMLQDTDVGTNGLRKLFLKHLFIDTESEFLNV